MINEFSLVGDGYAGLPDEAPFDCIHVGAAAPGMGNVPTIHI